MSKSFNYYNITHKTHELIQHDGYIVISKWMPFSLQSITAYELQISYIYTNEKKKNDKFKRKLKLKKTNEFHPE